MSADKVIEDVNKALIEAWQKSEYVDAPRLMIIDGEVIGDGRPVSHNVRRKLQWIDDVMRLKERAKK